MNTPVILERNAHKLIHKTLERCRPPRQRQYNIHQLLLAPRHVHLRLHRLNGRKRTPHQHLRNAMLNPRCRRMLMMDAAIGGGRFARPKVHLVLRTSRRIGAIDALDEIVEREARRSRRRGRSIRRRPPCHRLVGIPIQTVQRLVERVQQIFALVADRLLDDALAETELNRIDATEGEMIERYQFVFVVEWQAAKDFRQTRLFADELRAIGQRGDRRRCCLVFRQSGVRFIGTANGWRLNGVLGGRCVCRRRRREQRFDIVRNGYGGNLMGIYKKI